MISWIVFVLLGWLDLISQSTWLHLLAVNSIMPDLLMILVVSAAVLYGEEKGRMLGLILGLLQDLMFSRILGFHALIYFLCGHFSGCLTRSTSRNLLIIPVAIVCALDLGSGIIQYIFRGFLSGETAVFYSLTRTILPEAAYTSVFALFLYPLNRLIAHGCRIMDEHFKMFMKEIGRGI